MIDILLAYNVPSTRGAYDRDTRSLQYSLDQQCRTDKINSEC